MTVTPCAKTGKRPTTKQPTKPFASRWPEGHHKRAEDRAPFGDNLAYPAQWDPDTYTRCPIRPAWWITLTCAQR